MNRISISLIFSCVWLIPSSLLGRSAMPDTIQLRELVISSDARENRTLRQRAMFGTTIDKQEAEDRGLRSLKDLSSWVPNLFIPQYGSRQITSIYMRGVGSRTNTPSVGLYVDDVPWINKSSYDFSLDQIERIEVLKGPQSTLYGQNAMGGLIRVVTRNPLDYQGSDLTFGAASYNAFKASATHYHKVSPKVGFSGGVSYNHDGGFFKNDLLGEKADKADIVRSNLRLLARPSEVVRLDFHVSYEYSKQGAYPYKLEKVPDNDFFKHLLLPSLGKIRYNREGTYDRHLLNTGLKAEHRWKKVVMSSVTGFQYLKDEMQMDQDFTSVDIYSLSQYQHSHSLTEEIALKNRLGAWKHWEWTTGASLYAQWLKTDAPVSFQKDGLAWINHNINSYANMFMPPIQSGPMTMTFNFQDMILGNSLSFPGMFKTPQLDLAIYHQSTVRDLFSVKGLDVLLGLRLGYEKVKMNYDTGYQFKHTYSLSGHLDSPFLTRDIDMVPATTFAADNKLQGHLQDDNIQVLPKVSILQRFDRGNVYGTVSRGFRSGGYNFQLFSDPLNSMMQADMMKDVADVTVPVMNAHAAIPQQTKEVLSQMLYGMARQPEVDAQELCLFKPEYAWNYELGTHLDLIKNRLELDAAAFFTRVTDLQITQMAPSGMGRVTVNAGRSRQMGAELALRAHPTDALQMHVSYGFTHATFRTYKFSETLSYRGHYVPFAPKHTLDVGARYDWMLKGWLDKVSVNANWHALGKLYWNEQNTESEDFYGLLDASITLTKRGVDFSLWGQNLTNQHYRSFYFDTMNRGFSQSGRPIQVGADVRVRF